MSIKSFLKLHEDWVLIASAALLVAIVVLFFSWGITLLAQNIGNALETPNARSGSVEFNIEGASKLDFRGLNPAQ